MRCAYTAIVIATLSWASASIAADSVDAEKAAAARALLERNGIDTSLAIDQFMAFGNGGGVVSGFQMHDGLKVFDAPLTYHFGPGGEPVRSPDGRVFAMLAAKDLTGFELDEDALLDTDSAIDIVRDTTATALPAEVDGDTLSSVQNCATSSARLNVELGILSGRPTWQLRCKFSRSPGIFVDAYTGELVAPPPTAEPATPPLPISIPTPAPIEPR